MIPAMDVRRQYASLKRELDQATLDVLNSGQYILGKKVSEFEADMADYIGVNYAVGVGSGTDAIVMALRACGVKPGDEVVTSAMSFFSTAEAVAVIGAKPVFADCTRDTYLLDVSRVEEKITDKTRAVIPVHLYGQCVDMDPLLELAEKYGLKVIEDAAQACGAEYKGRKAGSMGDAGCMSFFPTKNLGCAGDGGMVVTDHESICRQCRALRVHGSGLDGLYAFGMENRTEVDEGEADFHGNLPKYYNFVLGYNSRLDALQASLLSVKLPYLDRWNRRRREIAGMYDKGIVNPGITKPYVSRNCKPVYYTYTVAARDREGLRKYLNDNGISSGVYFPLPLPQQRVFKNLGYKKGDMPGAEFVGEHTLVLPMFPELTNDEINKVIEVVNRWNS